MEKKTNRKISNWCLARRAIVLRGKGMMEELVKKIDENNPNQGHKNEECCYIGDSYGYYVKLG